MKTKCLFVVVGIVVAASARVPAHHAFSAEFDLNKPVTLNGTVTKVEWANPHIWVYLDVKDKGDVQHWQCEGGAPNTLVRNGLTKNSMKFGELITIDGWRAKDASNTCNLRVITLEDGRKLNAGTSSGVTQ